MRFLDTLEIYLTESTEDKSKFKIVPVDFDEENAYSFSIEDDGEEVAKVAIKTLDGQPIDGLSAPYSYDEVYADVEMNADEDNPLTLPLAEWIKETLDNMGYDENPIRINNDEHHMDDEGDDRGVDAEDDLPDSTTGYEVDWSDSIDGDKGETGDANMDAKLHSDTDDSNEEDNESKKPWESDEKTEDEEDDDSEDEE